MRRVMSYEYAVELIAFPSYLVTLNSFFIKEAQAFFR